MYWTLSETGTDFGSSTAPHLKVTNGGTEPPPPPPPPPVSIIFSRPFACSLTLALSPASDTSSSSESFVKRGRPPPNSPLGRSTPVVGLNVQTLVLETV